MASLKVVDSSKDGKWHTDSWRKNDYWNSRPMAGSYKQSTSCESDYKLINYTVGLSNYSTLFIIIKYCWLHDKTVLLYFGFIAKCYSLTKYTRTQAHTHTLSNTQTHTYFSIILHNINFRPKQICGILQ